MYKMEKDNDSIATVQMKGDYAASEVYSTASEPPPAYHKTRNTNSVKIAKIVGATVIISSMIIGFCILGSTYLQARASCNYMEQVAALERELLMDRFDDYPRAEALHESESNGNNLIGSDEKKEVKKNINKMDSEAKIDSDTKSTTENDTDSTYSESDESEELNRVQIKLPLELELDAIANAILQTQQKSKMNCIVERRRAEEFVDAPAKTVKLPFGLNINTDPKQQKVTGEKILIMCESGTEQKNNEDNDEVEHIRQIVVPLGAVPLQFGPRGPQFPLTHLPHQMGPVPQSQMTQPRHEQQIPFEQFMKRPPFVMNEAEYRQQQAQSHVPPQFTPQFRVEPRFIPQQQFQAPPQFQPPQQHHQQFQPQPQHFHQQPQMQVHQLPPQPPIPAQMMQAPRPEPEVRIQLRRVQIPIREMNMNEDVMQHRQESEQESEQQPQLQIQQLPLAVALQRAGITPDDLRNIQRIAEEKIHEELRQFVSDESSESDDNDSSSSEEQQDSHQQDGQQHEQQQQQQNVQPQILQMGRASFGRSLINPVRIPVPMMQVQDMQQPENQEGERPHYVHPRSVDEAAQNE